MIQLYYSKKVLHHQFFTTLYMYHFFLSIPKLNFKFDNNLDTSDTTINLFGNIMWKSIKLHFSVSTNIWNFFKSHQIFSGSLEFSFVFKLLL